MIYCRLWRRASTTFTTMVTKRCPGSLFLVAFLAVLGCPSTIGKQDSVKVTVFYESYSPYCKDFIVHQLLPVWAEFKRYIHLDLVPYGLAEQWYDRGHFNFLCHNGPQECVGNKLHACAVDSACRGTTSQACPPNKLTQALDYILCVIQHSDQEDATDDCAFDAGLSSVDILRCADSRRGEELLSLYGNVTKAFNRPIVTFVPMVVVGGAYSDIAEEFALTNLRAVMCMYFPDKCRTARNPITLV